MIVWMSPKLIKDILTNVIKTFSHFTEQKVFHPCNNVESFSTFIQKDSFLMEKSETCSYEIHLYHQNRKISERR